MNDEYSRYHKYSVSQIEEQVIEKHFDAYIDGNDFDLSGMSTPEMKGMYNTFKTGWIMARAFTSNRVYRIEWDEKHAMGKIKDEVDKKISEIVD